MKNYILIAMSLFLILSAGNTMAQDQEMKYLFQGKDGNVSISGFGGVFNEFSGFDNDFAFSMGGGAAMLISQRIYFGGYGMGVTTRHMRSFSGATSNGTLLYPSDELYARFGHGGFWLGYIHNPKKAIHWGVNAKLGWGAVSLTDKTYKDYNDSWNNLMYDNVFVITPEVNMGLNLLKWMRVNVGVGYRVVTGVDETYMAKDGQGGLVKTQYFDSNAFNSVTGNITLAFGWFNN